MHHFFATLFSLLIAFSHHSSLSSHTVASAELTDVITIPSTAGPAVILPDRYQLARYSSEDASYAETVCLSCRRMDSPTMDR